MNVTITMPAFPFVLATVAITAGLVVTLVSLIFDIIKFVEESRAKKERSDARAEYIDKEE